MISSLILTFKPILGMYFMEGAWLAGTIFIFLLGSFIIGYFYKPDEHGPLIIAFVSLLVLLALFWPVLLLFVGSLAVIASPVLLGIYARKLKNKQDEERKRQYETLSGSEKILK